MKIKILLYLLYSSVFFSQTGNVGIGTTSPETNLHIKGTLRLEHPSQSEGYILQVFDKGSVKWSPLIPNSVLGFLGSPEGYSGDVPVNSFMNGTINLPPGKWMVKVSMLIPSNYTVNAVNDTRSALRYNDIAINVTTYFSDSNTNSAITTDYISGSAKSISGSLVTPSIYGMLEGYALLNNTGQINKTYYLWGKTTRNSITSDANAVPLYRLSGYWGENRIYAYPIDTN